MALFTKEESQELASRMRPGHAALQEAASRYLFATAARDASLAAMDNPKKQGPEWQQSAGEMDAASVIYRQASDILAVMASRGWWKAWGDSAGEQVLEMCTRWESANAEERRGLAQIIARLHTTAKNMAASRRADDERDMQAALRESGWQVGPSSPSLIRPLSLSDEEKAEHLGTAPREPAGKTASRRQSRPR